MWFEIRIVTHSCCPAMYYMCTYSMCCSLANKWMNEFCWTDLLICCFVVFMVSSAVVWEGKDKKKFRPFASSLSKHLEECYSQYLLSLHSDSARRKSRVLQDNFEVSQNHFVSVYQCVMCIWHVFIKLLTYLFSYLLTYSTATVSW